MLVLYGGLQSALNRGVINERMIGKGMTKAEADAMLAKVSIEALQLDKDGKIGKSNGSATVIKATLMLILLSIPIMLYGLDMARAIIEEKTSRIFEVMLAVAKPGDLLAGKLLGVGGVGITQIAIWVVGGHCLYGHCAGRLAAHRRHRHPFLLGRGHFLPHLFCVGIRSLQRHLFRPRGHLRNRAGFAEVHVGGDCSALYSHGLASGDDQRPQLRLEHCRNALSADLALYR